MLTGVHLLLTYRCTSACDHCFVYGSPRARGTFTLDRIQQALEQAKEVGTVEWIYFEGGEPFLLYPVLLEGIKRARVMGFEAGVVTNCYWAETKEDAKLWLEPLMRLGVRDLTVSDDPFHHGDAEESPAARVRAAAERLGIPVNTICVPHPSSAEGVRYRGRAADVLVEGQPRFPKATFTECPDEDLRNPSRVHLDADGNVHLCQGVLLGNAWEMPLVDLVKGYHPDHHPVCGALLRGGPAALGTEYEVEMGPEWASACHLCFATRRKLRDRFGRFLGPDQVYEEP